MSVIRDFVNTLLAAIAIFLLLCLAGKFIFVPIFVSMFMGGDAGSAYILCLIILVLSALFRLEAGS